MKVSKKINVLCKMELNQTERELLEWYVEMANHPFWILKRFAVNQIIELMTLVYYARAKW